MPELLFEIGTEELPAHYVKQGAKALAELASERLKAARLPSEAIESFATPRRLAIRTTIPLRQERLEMKRRGPALAAAFKDGQPTAAAVGFAKANNITIEELSEEDGYLWAQIIDEGKNAAEVLPELLAGLIADLPAGRKMRWGEGTAPFIRPIRWLVALLDQQVIPVEAAGLKAHQNTQGHRFLSGFDGLIIEPQAYENVLQQLSVVVDRNKRRELVLNEAQAVARPFALAFDDDLLDEVADLVEFPLAIMGNFAEKYLELPDEVLSTVMIHHQRYFPLRNLSDEGKLTNKFIAISNNKGDENLIRHGYETVLSGRLADADFFWQADISKPLIEHREKLAGMAFQKGLGSMLDKNERTIQLALQVAHHLKLDMTPFKAILPLFKADLGTQMVFELPELAGTMGRIYAEREGLSHADLLEEANKPLTNDGELPKNLPSSVLALADRLDTLVGFFAIGKIPTGSTDPFGLRRAGIAVVRLLTAKKLAVSLDELLNLSADIYKKAKIEVKEQDLENLKDFLLDRLQNLLEEAGLKSTQFRAASAISLDLLDISQRSWLLSYLNQSEEFSNLAMLYKRVSNITKDIEKSGSVKDKLFETNEEKNLNEGLFSLNQAIDGLISTWRNVQPFWDIDFDTKSNVLPSELQDNLNQLISFKSLLDIFLDKVLVMVEDEKIKNNRLALLVNVRDELSKLGKLELL